MPLTRLLPVLLALVLPCAAAAEISSGDLPGNARWYLHADIEAMRGADSGGALYRWMHDEVFADIKDDIGIDLGRELDAITAFADSSVGTVVVVEGPISSETRDKLLALAAVKARLDTLTHDGKTYYHLQRTEGTGGSSRRLDDFDGAAWFSFAVADKLIVTSEQKQLEALLESGGRIAGSGSHAGSLFVLTADKEFVQAGARTAELADDDTDWNSNILRNTEKAALLVSDRNGLLAVEAQLVSKDPTIAQSLGGIVNGLISLQALNTDLDPEVLGLLQNTKVEILENVLAISTVFDPAVVAGLLDDR